MFRPLHSALVLTSVLAMALSARQPNGQPDLQGFDGGTECGTFKTMGTVPMGDVVGERCQGHAAEYQCWKAYPISGGTGAIYAENPHAESRGADDGSGR